MPSETAADAPIHVPSLLPGMAPLAGDYDGFVVDLWGTVHDGFEPLPGAVDCLRALKEADKRVLFLSNAPRRAHTVRERMIEIGIPPELAGDVFCSGEAAHQALKDRSDPAHAALGERCLLMAPPGDDSLLEGLDLERVERLENADFILGVGAFDWHDTVDRYDGFLLGAHRHDLPLVCANPDLEVLHGGKRLICAGAIAKRYEEIGGRVIYHGKPDAEIYRKGLARLGLDDPARALAIGDSLRTDIAGALEAGMGTLFITGGIYASELGVEGETPPALADLRALYARHGVTPHAAITGLRWSGE